MLTGVLLDKAFFDTTAPGVYLYGFSSLGTAQNYEVSSVVPRFLTIAKKPVSGFVLDTRTLLGATPAQFDAVFTEPVRGGPPVPRPRRLHRIQHAGRPARGGARDRATGWRNACRARAVLHVRSLAGLTVCRGAAAQSHCPDARTFLTATEAQEKMKEMLKENEESKVRIVTNLYGANPFTPVELARAVEDFVPDIIPRIGAMLASGTQLDPMHRTVLEQVQSGKLRPVVSPT